jgi:hypothetical protein
VDSHYNEKKNTCKIGTFVFDHYFVFAGGVEMKCDSLGKTDPGVRLKNLKIK